MYQVAYAFPSAWNAAGSSPQSTMIKWEDPKTHLPVLFGTTRGGGTVNYGALFRLTGLDLPPVQQPTHPMLLKPTAWTKTQSKSFPVAGQSQPLLIIVTTDIDGNQLKDDGTPTNYEQGKRGIKIDAANCRNPHIVQFISRDKFDVLRKEQTWQQEDSVYKDISINAATDSALDWINLRLQPDASGKQYPPLP